MTIFDSIGREEGCRRLSQSFYSRVQLEPVLRPLFPGKSVRCASEEFAAFLIELFQGDESQCAYRWHISLIESHARFKISTLHRNAWLAAMRQTLAEFGLSQGDEESLGQFFEAAAASIFRGAIVSPDSSELAELWSTEWELEEIRADINHKRWGGCLRRCERFASRPRVLAGICSELLKAGAAEAACRLIKNFPQSARAKFNGRPLLHFATSIGSLIACQTIVELGAKPMELDDRGHAALYRVGSIGGREGGEEIVKVLMAHGAEVNHAGGVSRATALHQAARHGSLPAARALLEAGADANARDRRGLTPLDRAVRCRQHKVAAFLGQKV